jgi:hypothetical protein
MSDQPFKLSCMYCETAVAPPAGDEALEAGWHNIWPAERDGGEGVEDGCTHLGVCPECQKELEEVESDGPRPA